MPLVLRVVCPSRFNATLCLLRLFAEAPCNNEEPPKEPKPVRLLPVSKAYKSYM